MAKKEYIEPTRKEKSEWKKYLYNALLFLATERPEFRPRKRDSLETLKESFFYWADEYNDGYFSEQDDADTDRYCAWLVQEHLMATDIKKFYAEYDHPFVAEEREKEMKNMENLIKDATLLSLEEAEQVSEDISKFEGWWWLRSPGINSIYAAGVSTIGCVCRRGHIVDTMYACVRPALHLNLSSKLTDGMKLVVGDYTFTVVCGGKYALCDTPVGKSIFHNDCTAEDANVYEASDVKRFVDRWYEDGIKGQEYHITEAWADSFEAIDAKHPVITSM